jgi:hypothetical protein
VCDKPISFCLLDTEQVTMLEKIEKFQYGNFFKNIIVSCYKNYQFKHLGIIIPSDYQLNSFDHFNVIDQLKFRNGGIPVVFYILESK